MRKPGMPLFIPLLMLAMSGSAQALESTFEVRCQTELPRANISIRAEENGYKIFNNVSARILSEKGIHNYSSELLMGMTDLRSAIEIGFDGPVLTDAGKSRECLAPQIEVVLRYNQMRVYIAREFSESSCPYREMLAHEMQHVQIYQQQLPLVAERVKAAMEQRFAQRPLMASNGESKAMLDHELDSQWLPFIRAELNKVERMQQELDSREESFRLSNSCFGQTSKVMGGSFY